MVQDFFHQQYHVKGGVKKSTNFFDIVFVLHCFIDDEYPHVLSSAQACKLLLKFQVEFQVDLPQKLWNDTTQGWPLDIILYFDILSL